MACRGLAFHPPAGPYAPETISLGKGSDAISEPKTYRLEAPGAVLAYDVRGNGGAEHPVLLLIGSPMGASGFAALAEQFADRTVVTYDPRGTERSQRTDGKPPGSEPGEHVEDLRRLIHALDAGPADVFGSSGGAVNALDLVARHPRLVRTLVAHEPPAAQELPDREPVLAACADIRETYQHSGFGPAMATFIALVSHAGPIPPSFPGQPAPDPTAFGLPANDDGSRDDPLLGLHMTACVGYQHDVAAPRAAPTRIVLGVCAQSGQMLAGRAAVAVAARLGTTPVTFPGGHDSRRADRERAVTPRRQLAQFTGKRKEQPGWLTRSCMIVSHPPAGSHLDEPGTAHVARGS